jgi:plastocyanin
MVKRALSAALMLAIAVALIGGLRSESAGTMTPGASPDTSPVASPIASPVASPVSSRVGRSISVAESVTIQLQDGWFDPAYVASTNGHDLTITLINAGSRQHAFRIDRYQVDVSLAPGETQTIVIQEPTLGDFTYYSDAPGDEGMEGQLTFYI